MEFHLIDDLPNCYGVFPFIPKLRRWISTEGKRIKKAQAKGETVARVQGKKKKDNPAVSVDDRNTDTFTNESGKGWKVQDMFEANAKLTGKSYTYDGNPHSFGDRHPRYVNYADAGVGAIHGAGTGVPSGTAPIVVSVADAFGSEEPPVPTPITDPAGGGKRKGGKSAERGSIDEGKKFSIPSFKLDTQEILDAVDASLRNNESTLI